MTDLAELAAAYVLGFVLAAVAWRMGRGIFERPVFERRNYRDRPLPTAVGVLLPLVVGAVVGVHVVVFDVWQSAFGPSASGWGAVSAYGPVTLELAVAFSFLGLLDDLGGVGESGGFSGHLAALAHGRLTTGLIKMIGGPLLSLAILAGFTVHVGRVGYLRDAAVVCLAANLANLFDRAPGRVNKVAQLAFLVLAVSTLSARLAPIAIVVGAAAALLSADLHEQLMLGDAGSNVLGAVLGFGVVVATTEQQRWIVLVVLLALNLASEFVSFSRVIDAVAPLRGLDRLGSDRPD